MTATVEMQLGRTQAEATHRMVAAIWTLSSKRTCPTFVIVLNSHLSYPQGILNHFPALT